MGSLRVERTSWEIEGKTLRKRYVYFWLDGPPKVTEAQIAIDGQDERLVCFFLFNPPLFPISEDGHLVAQLALLADPSGEPFVTVIVCKTDEGHMTVAPLEWTSQEAFLQVMARCQDMRLMLYNHVGQSAELPFPNDEQFGQIAPQFLMQLTK